MVTHYKLKSKTFLLHKLTFVSSHFETLSTATSSRQDLLDLK